MFLARPVGTDFLVGPIGSGAHPAVAEAYVAAERRISESLCGPGQELDARPKSEGSDSGVGRIAPIPIGLPIAANR